MGNRALKHLSLLSLILIVQTGFGQGNPGFLGKKIAIGYSGQYCLLRSESLFFPAKGVALAQVLINHDMYAEYATSKYGSWAVHLSYQKVPIHISGGASSYSERIAQDFTLNGQTYTEYFNRDKGVSDFRLLGIGLRYTFYSPNKTISSPIGIGYYFRFDRYSNKPLNNNYKYSSAYSTNDDLTDEQREYAYKNMKKDFSNSASTNYSIGLGVESKYPVTSSVYFRLNGEFNFSLNLFQQLNESSNSSSSDYLTVSEDMAKMSKSLNNYRNMLLLGMGIGVLL